MNVTTPITSVLTTTIPNSKGEELIFGRHAFAKETPGVAIPCLIILFIAAIVGTFGNVLIIVAIFTQPKLRNKESIFIFNLAMSDMYVTLIADPMSIVAKLEGEEFFFSIPYLCQIIGSMCTISCVTSLCTIAMFSLNRYIHICHNHLYEKIYRKKVCIGICISLYGIGISLVLLNLAGVGDHTFDRKSLECIWDRMATFPYTVVFSIILVWIPIIIVGLSYLSLYIHVRKSHKRVQTYSKGSGKNTQTPINLAKSIFIIYAVFSACWIPYALLIVLDTQDSFSHIAHVYIVVFAHLHPSLNWLIYCLTNRNFADAFRKILGLNNCKLLRKSEDSSTTMSASCQSGTNTASLDSPDSNVDL